MKTVKLLLEHGADPERLNEDGESRLHKAALHGRLEIVGTYLEHGTNPWLKNTKGETPVSYVTRSCRGAMVRLLVQNDQEFLARRFFQLTPPVDWDSEPPRSSFYAKGIDASHLKWVALMR